MLSADPDRIPVTTGQSHMPLEGASAFTTDDPAGKRVSVSVEAAIFLYVFIPGMLLDQCTDNFKILPADDRFMMVLYIKLILFITVDVPLEAEIRVGLLEKEISYFCQDLVTFIRDVIGPATSIFLSVFPIIGN
jgi:hypothetical protein